MEIEDKKNYIYNIIYRLSICILPLIVTPYVARALGAEHVGVYAFSSTIACYFILLGKLGLDNYGNRSVAFCRESIEKRSKVFWEIYFMQIITSTLSILIYIFLILTIFQENREIYWIQLMYVGSILFDVSWFFYAMEKFKITMIRSVISRGIIIVCVFSFVHTKEDLWIYTLVMAASFLIEQLQLFPLVFSYVKWVPIKKQDIIPHILPNIRLFIPLVALSIYNWMDKLMLGILLKGTAVVAFYTYAENIINLPKGILSALDAVMLPKISNLVARNRLEEGLQQMRMSVKLNSIVSCALCFGIAGVSGNFIPWFFGEEFTPVVPLVIGFSIAMIPMGITSVVQNQYLIPFHQETIYIKGVSLGAGINVVLNLLLIPVYGAAGAIIGTVSAEIIVCVYQIYHIRSILQFFQLIQTIFPFLLCGIFEFLAVFYLGKLNFSPLFLLSLQVIIGGFVYLFGCSVYFLFNNKEYQGLKDSFFHLKKK